MNRKNPEHSVAWLAPENRLDFEKFLIDLSTRLVALPPDRVDDEIRNALRKVLEFFQIDRCSLLQLLPCKTLWQVNHAATATGIQPYPIEIGTAIVPWTFRKLAVEREVFSFAGLEELPAEADVDKQGLEKFGMEDNPIMKDILNLQYPASRAKLIPPGRLTCSSTLNYLRRKEMQNG